MRRIRMTGILVIEAVFCVAFCLMENSFSGGFAGVMAFPFEQIGWGFGCFRCRVRREMRRQLFCIFCCA